MVVEASDAASGAATAANRGAARQSGPAAAADHGAIPGTDSARAYFAAAAHCGVVAGRIAAALRDRPGVVVVAGDPAPEAGMLAPALAATAARWRVIARSCNADLTPSSLRRAAAAAAQSETMMTRLWPPLFLLDAADRLSEPQLAELLAMRTGEEAAVVLLAGSGFDRRLTGIPAADDRAMAVLRFDELDEAEVAGFIRHRLGAAGGFAPEVVAVIARAAGGDPALVERLARLVLGLAGDGGQVPAAGLLLRPAGSAVAAEPAGVAAGVPRLRGRRALFAGLAAVAGLTAAAAILLALDTARPPAPPAAAAAELAVLLDRGDGFRAAGDIASARLFYERATEAGSGGAALRLGDSFDPARLARAGVRGAPGDVARAGFWYRRAAALGEPAAADRLARLGAETR